MASLLLIAGVFVGVLGVTLLVVALGIKLRQRRAGGDTAAATDGDTSDPMATPDSHLHD